LRIINVTGAPQNYGSLPSTTVANNLTSNHFGCPLIGPDGRMYIPILATNSVHIIPNPDNNPVNLQIYKLEHLLDFGNDGIVEANGLCFPIYASFYLQLNLELTSPPLCKNNQADFQLSVIAGEDGNLLSYYILDWGDGSPTITNSSPLLDSSYNYTHTYAEKGDYTVTFNAYDTSGNVLLPNTKNIHVAGCGLPVNPHLRGKME
jgi:PKD repeat protein